MILDVCLPLYYDKCNVIKYVTLILQKVGAVWKKKKELI